MQKNLLSTIIIAVAIIGCTYWYVKRADDRHHQAMHEAEMHRRAVEDADLRRAEDAANLAEQIRMNELLRPLPPLLHR
jgi:uncharacterized protein YpmB